MSAVDNLLANMDKVAYTNYLPSDKIAMYSTMTDSSGDGIGAGGRLSPVVGSFNGISGSNNVATIPNPYGKRCQMTLSWSLDGVNFYPAQVPIMYYNASYQGFLVQLTCFGGCSDSTITLVAYSEYTGGNQSVYIQFALDSPA